MHAVRLKNTRPCLRSPPLQYPRTHALAGHVHDAAHGLGHDANKTLAQPFEEAGRAVFLRAPQRLQHEPADTVDKAADEPLSTDWRARKINISKHA